MEHINVDIDAHVAEPIDVLNDYLEPQFKDRPIRLLRDDIFDFLVDGGLSPFSSLLISASSTSIFFRSASSSLAASSKSRRLFTRIVYPQ